MLTVLFIGHGGYYNRGCEALVRTTSLMLRRYLGDVRVILSSYDAPGDTDRQLALVDDITPFFASRFSPAWMLAHLPGMSADKRNYWWTAPLQRVLPEVDVLMSIGGDNYCAGDRPFYYYLDAQVRSVGKPTVLWGASLEPKGITPRMRNDLASFSLITARDPLTTTALAEYGITTTVREVADPAFTMVPEPVDIAPFWPSGDQILGYNISPLLERFGKGRSASEMVAASVETLRHAIDRLHLGVVLVPHVTQPMPAEESGNDDALLLQEIMTLVERPGRISLLPGPMNAAQTKHVIAQCAYFMGARTHSTIGALSSCVPTVSIAYSSKAWGVNLATLGTTEHVCDVADISAPTLIAHLTAVVKKGDTLRGKLANTVPGLVTKANLGGKHLAELLGIHA
jgi:colanic acid/amylovoran biosynthesis protein